jgi:hypothetical protein
MFIALNTSCGRVLANTDSVRVFAPLDNGKTMVMFNGGHRLDVDESIDQIYSMINK